MNQIELKEYAPVAKHSIRTVLLATDGTSYAERALENSIRMTRHAGGRLIITYFADPKDTTLFEGFPYQNEEDWQAYGRNILARLEERARRDGVYEVETVLERYQGEESLTNLAQQVNADIIMLASHLFRCNGLT
ncbi:MAG: universal stress protein [Chloroflexota bacterium]|nr:universal stress protein [Chloroflexota bacterium]